MKFLEIVKKHKLENYLKVLLLNNDSNNLPYHNLYHAMSVVEFTDILSTSEDIYKKEHRLLLIAGLFHDFNHSGGKNKDDVNVKDAIKAFEKYSEESKEDNTFIIDIIKATEYPYVIENPNIYQQIMRDADLLQATKENWLQQIVVGLGSELKQDLIPFLKGQAGFWGALKFNTKKAISIWEKHKNSNIEDANFIYNLIK